MTCLLCGQPVTLFELADWQGEPAHQWCAEGAQDAFDEAVDEIARRHRERNDRLGKRYQAPAA